MHTPRSFFVIGFTVATLLVGFAAPAYATGAPQGPPFLSLPAPPKFFNTFGDYVHISSTPPPTASGHGWWERIDNEAIEAVVTVQLQINRAGLWLDVGSPGSSVVKSGGGSANRVTARVACVGSDPHEWRSVVDVDLVGYLDSADKKITPPRLLPCSA